MRIIGIDASLSSTGFAVSKCNFEEKYKRLLFKLLTEKNGVDSKSLKNCFSLLFTTEIHEDKDTAKQLAKVRKNIRDAEKEGVQPNLIDNVEEERLSTKKIQDQIMEINKSLCENIEPPCVTFVFIEDYSYHSPGSLTQLAEMKGVMKHCMSEFIKIWNSPPTYYLTANINTVKKIGGRNGNANKELMCEEIKRFGFQSVIELDDQTDAIAVALASYYAMYNRLFPFVVPEGLKAKERKYYQSFIDSLNTFGNRIGSREDLLKLI